MPICSLFLIADTNLNSYRSSKANLVVCKLGAKYREVIRAQASARSAVVDSVGRVGRSRAVLNFLELAGLVVRGGRIYLWQADC